MCEFGGQEERGRAATGRLCKAQGIWVQNPARPYPNLRMQTAGTQPEPSRDRGPAAVGRALGSGVGHPTVSFDMYMGARQQAPSATKDIVAELGPVSTSNKYKQA